MIDISVIIPLLNEEENIGPLYEKLTTVLASLNSAYEIIFVDDGSSDNSLAKLTQFYEKDTDHVRVLELRRNYGKTAALVAGFEQAEGEILITMDADLQDDPNEIPAMIEELKNGYDLVAAWRINRQDPGKKRLSSSIFNFGVAKLTGTRFNDLNCGFKVYRRQVIKSIRLYSDLHRYIPILAVWQGYKVVEKPVKHHPRHSGQSKYGTGRVTRGIMDLIMVLFLVRYLRQPLRLFGWIGSIILMGGSFINVYLAVLWLLRFLNLADVPPIGTRPLLTVGVLGILLGIQLISIGLLGEMLRYFTYRPKEEFSVRRVWA